MWPEEKAAECAKTLYDQQDERLKRRDVPCIFWSNSTCTNYTGKGVFRCSKSNRRMTGSYRSREGAVSHGNGTRNRLRWIARREKGWMLAVPSEPTSLPSTVTGAGFSGKGSLTFGGLTLLEPNAGFSGSTSGSRVACGIRTGSAGWKCCSFTKRLPAITT